MNDPKTFTEYLNNVQDVSKNNCPKPHFFHK